MYLRLIGALAVLASSVVMGHSKAHRYTERPRLLRDLIASLQLLETEINYGFIPLPDAFADVATRCRVPVSVLYKNAARLMTKDYSVREAWEDSVRELYEKSALSEIDKSILLRLGESLGRSDRDDQARHLKLASESLRAAEDEAIKEREHKARLWLYMGWGTGICTVIMLY